MQQQLQQHAGPSHHQHGRSLPAHSQTAIHFKHSSSTTLPHAANYSPSPQVYHTQNVGTCSKQQQHRPSHSHTSTQTLTCILSLSHRNVFLPHKFLSHSTVLFLYFLFFFMFVSLPNIWRNFSLFICSVHSTPWPGILSNISYPPQVCH